MIRDLYINEKIMISLTKNNKINALKINDSMMPKMIDQDELEFIRHKASVMDKLKEGRVINITTDGTTITSDIIDSTGKGYSVSSSIEDLEFNLNAKRR